ncbi:Lamin-B2 [Fukomys damarensis]|uniref:Lamin-B2 n=1 Tax=Fukomys damarensis TaxID=885580 RepID=A0A091EM48_FUKDA|nr:Lamin-B2 [Fukomys damarensis]
MKDPESLSHWSEVELAALGDKSSPESNVVDGVQVPGDRAEDGHTVAKKQPKKEMLMCVDLENHCQSLRKELDFQKSVFEEVHTCGSAIIYEGLSVS